MDSVDAMTQAWGGRKRNLWTAIESLLQERYE